MPVTIALLLATNALNPKHRIRLYAIDLKVNARYRMTNIMAIEIDAQALFVYTVSLGKIIHIKFHKFILFIIGFLKYDDDLHVLIIGSIHKAKC